MNTQEYVINATKTESTDFDKITERLSQKGNVRLLHGAIGLATEAGEFLDALKNIFITGKPLDRVNLAEELGDLFWYCAIIADELQVPFSDIMDKNIEKLKPDTERSLAKKKAENRNLKVERKILEN